MGVSGRLRAGATAIWLLGCAGCSNGPGSSLGRLTESGRLLADGPPARMTEAAVADSRAQSVPLLYTFAVEAGQILPGGGAPFPATDLAQQQAALSSGVIDWPAVTLVGEGYIDAQCDRFLGALDRLEREKRATLANLNALQSATVGIMGLALAAQKTIGIVGVAFGLVASLIDNTTSAVLYELPAPSVRAIVKAQRDVLRDEETKPGGVLDRVRNQGLASARLAEYIEYCVPVTIEANIGKVLSSALPGTRGTIVTAETPAAITSALAPVITAIPPGVPLIRVAPTNPSVATVLDPAVQARLRRLLQAVRGVRDPQTLRGAAAALQIPAADTAGLDADVLRSRVILEVDQRVRGAGAGTSEQRMDEVAGALSGVLGRQL